MSKVWLITDSASGYGRQLTEAALAAGDCVLATARNTEGLADLLTKYPARVRALALDVTDEMQGILAMQTAVDVFGRVDVLVNNDRWQEFPVPIDQASVEPIPSALGSKR